MGAQKIFLHEVSVDKSPLIVSKKLTECLVKENSSITLYESSVLYLGRLFLQSSTKLQHSMETHNPSTFPVLEESLINDPIELALTAHKESLRIDSLYRHELKVIYNNLIEEYEELGRRIQEHQDVFTGVDQITVEETDKLYDIFLAKYNTSDPIPVEEDINRIRFLNESTNKYLQSHFIFWNRLSSRVRLAKMELDATTQNIYLQLAKDFPDIEGIPVDPMIDISRSYPGKIFPKDL